VPLLRVLVDPGCLLAAVHCFMPPAVPATDAMTWQMHNIYQHLCTEFVERACPNNCGVLLSELMLLRGAWLLCLLIAELLYE
jgi:hypothetical protein